MEKQGSYHHQRNAYQNGQPTSSNPAKDTASCCNCSRYHCACHHRCSCELPSVFCKTAGLLRLFTKGDLCTVFASTTSVVARWGSHEQAFLARSTASTPRAVRDQNRTTSRYPCRAARTESRHLSTSPRSFADGPHVCCGIGATKQSAYQKRESDTHEHCEDVHCAAVVISETPLSHGLRLNSPTILKFYLRIHQPVGLFAS